MFSASTPSLFSVLPRPPHPTRDGLAIRNYHLLKALAGPFRVRSFVLVPQHLAGEPSEYPPGVEVEVVPHGSRAVRQALAIGASVLGGGAYPEMLYGSRRLARLLSRRAAHEKPAWVVAHSYHVGSLALASARPAWIDFHNLDSEIWWQLGEIARSRFARAFARAQSPRVANLERRLARAAFGVSCVSARDAGLLSALGPRTAPLVVPNGADLTRYRFRDSPPPGETVLFVGDLGWAPNALGVRWLREEIWPEVKQLRPQARAEILGRNMPADLRREGGSDFVFSGDLTDTRPSWEAASVAVVPLRAGGGTRLKILEAAACGVPVVSTRVGAEGLDFQDGTEILLADDARAFASSVAKLLADPAAAMRQARAARMRAEKLYGWEEIGRRFAAELLSRAQERP
jgi:glycosyltransferase involved in cell wall biosynthesis